MKNYEMASLVGGYEELELLGTEYDTHTETIETAKGIYKEALEGGILPGRSVNQVAAASFRIASIKNGEPITLTEIGGWREEVNRKHIARVQRQVEKLTNNHTPPLSLEDRLPIELAKFDLSSKYIRVVYDMIESYDYTGGESPIVVISAAIYAAQYNTGVGKRLIQDEIARKTDVSTVSIRNKYQDILDAHRKSKDL